MPDVEVDRLQIKATSDITGAANGLKTLKDKLLDLQYVASTGIKIKDPLKLDMLTTSLQKLNNLKVSISKNVAEQIVMIGYAVDSLKGVDFSKLDALAEGLAKLSAIGNISVPKIIGGTGLGKVNETLSDTSALDGYINKEGELVDASEEAGASTTKFGNDLNHVNMNIMEAMKATDSLAESIRKNTNASFRELAESVKRVALSIGSLTLKIGLMPFAKLGNSIGNTVKKIGTFFAAIKRIALYRAIRTVLKEITQGFKEGMDNLYQYSKLINGEFARSMDMLATSSLYLKNSLGAMVGPIINALAPAVDFLTDKFVDLLNIVNETIASLTGASTWTRAIKYPVEYAEATDDATKAAKKFKATILGFDELNVLNDNSDNGRSKASDALDYSKMFTEEEVSTQTAAWVEKVKEAWANADFTDIGRSIGESLRDGLRNIPWEKLNSEGERFSRSLGTLINGFVTTPELGSTIGSSIAEAINTGVHTLHEFIDTVEWKKVGAFIGDGITGFFKTIDAKELAQTISDGILGVLDFAIGLFEQTDFEEIGKKIGEFLENVKWGEVLAKTGEAIWKGFKAALEGIGGLMKENPLAGAILVSILGLKVKEISSNLLTTIGIGGAGATTTAANGMAVTNETSLLASMKSMFTGDVTFSLGTATLSIATAYMAYQAGKSLYENNTLGIGDAADWLMDHGLGKAIDGIKGGIENIADYTYDILHKDDIVYIDQPNNIGHGINEFEIQHGLLPEIQTRSKDTPWLNPYLLNPEQEMKDWLKTWDKQREEINNRTLPTLKNLKGAVSEVNTELYKTPNNVLIGVRTNGVSDLEHLNYEIGLVPDKKDTSITAKTVGESTVKSLGSAISEIKSKTVTETAKVQGYNDVKNLADKVSALTKTGSNVVNLVMNVTKATDFEKNLKTVTGALEKAVIAIMPATSGLGAGLLKGFASGGTPDRGSLFLANENGPELVANIGSRTQVANNEQIIDGISAGVEMANAEQNMILREQNSLLRQLLSKDTNISISTDSIVSGLSRKNRRDGQATVAVG